MAGSKPATKGKKKGKSKLSKAEKERLKKEELERKAQEEEEAKIRAEQEAREREEREKLEQEERRKLEEKERAQHQAEIDELNRTIKENKDKLLELQQKRRIKEKWDRYMLCDGRPDPTSKKDLNTYMNLWKEDTSCKQFEEVLQECELTLELTSELEKYLEEDEELEEENRAMYRQSIDEMHKLLDSKVDEAMMWLLKIPGNNIDQETLNLKYIGKSKSFSASIWGNTAKNPRVKSVDFPTEGFIIEIPKSLVLADVAVRLLHKNYDNLSPKCSTFLPKVKTNSNTEEDQPNHQNQSDNPEKKTTEETSRNDEIKEETDPNHLEPIREKVGSRKQSRKSVSRSSISSSKEADKIVEENNKENENTEENTVENEMKMLDDLEEDLLDEDIVDLRSFAAMEPIIYIELFELPPQQHKVNQWIIQQITAAELKRLSYTTQSANLGKSLTESQYIEQENKVPSSAKSSSSVPSTPNVNAIKPIAISLKAPDNVIFFEDPQMARWDEESCHWKLDGFLDVSYDSENRTISFKTANFGPMAMIQDLYLNMPFQSWEVRPVSLNNCVIAVIAATVDVEIEIKNSQCCLRKPDEYKEISNLIGKWMSPEHLVKYVRKAGINIFPAKDGDKYVSICKKDPCLINNLYEQIALSSSAFAFSWSKWNSDCKEEEIVVVGATEWCKKDLPTEDDYSLYMASTRICYQLAMSEFDEVFSKEIAQGTQMHPNLFHVVQDGSSDEARNLVYQTDYQYVDCVYQLLKAINIMVYS